MGCDIHATIEVKKYKDDNFWLGEVRDIYIYRSYWLFSILAGVRGDEEPISKPRGVPEDASSEYKAKLEDWGGGAHSMSYVYFNELKEYPKKDFDYSTEKFYQIMELYAKDFGDENVRLIFFFDN
jgi:hypothetical protein